MAVLLLLGEHALHRLLRGHSHRDRAAASHGNLTGEAGDHRVGRAGKSRQRGQERLRRDEVRDEVVVEHFAQLVDGEIDELRALPPSAQRGDHGVEAAHLGQDLRLERLRALRRAHVGRHRDQPIAASHQLAQPVEALR
ncbi:MAG TPA: hypothetical protein VF993_01830 [Myxococcales bacterium]